MKKISLLLLLCVLSFSSCKKDDVEAVIDCALFEGDSNFSLTATVPDADYPKNIEFKLEYTGGQTITHALTWDFGDGNTLAGAPTQTHEYAVAGDYIVAVHIVINEAGKNNSCNHTSTKTITVE